MCEEHPVHHDLDQCHPSHPAPSSARVAPGCDGFGAAWFRPGWVRPSAGYSSAWMHSSSWRRASVLRFIQNSFRIHSEFIRNSFRFSYILICSGARSILWLSKPLPLLHKVPPKVLASGESSESVAGISAGIAVKQCKTRTCKSAHSQQPWCYYYIPTAGLVDSVKGGVLHSPSR